MEVIVKIMIELLSVLALSTKQIKQGRFSKCAVAYIYIVCGSIYVREIHQKVAGRVRDRGRSPKIGSIDPGRGSGDGCTDIGFGS